MTEERFVVGYTDTAAGQDAVALGARLAIAHGASLDVVVVLPAGDRSLTAPFDAGYDNYLRGKANDWLEKAVGLIPASVTRQSHVRYADSFAVGLGDAAAEFGATRIVVGAAGGGLRGRHRLGSTANELLHSSAVPVVLAPEGSRRIDPEVGITRVTAAIGTRPGAEVLLDEAVATATRTGAELRLVSLVTVDLPASVDTGVIRLAGEAHAAEVLASVQATLPDDLEVEVVVARGDSIEDAVQHLSWEPGEIAMVGSSRLAQPRRLFLGSIAGKMLHELPVPMIVVPRTRAAEVARDRAS